MSEPRRWKDAPDAPVGMRELLGSAKRSRPLDEVTFRRGAARVARFSVAPAAVAAVSVWAKLAAAAAVVGLAAAGAIAGIDAVRSPDTSTASAHARPSSPAVVPAPVATVEPPPRIEPTREPTAPVTLVTPVPAAPALVAARPQPQIAVAPATTAEPAVPLGPEEPARPKSTLGDELGLLESARGHLARSPETALAKLAEHRARYRSGVLANERDLMELDALRRAGRVEDARSRAAAWLARDPQGMHAARVRQILSSLQ